MYDFFHTDRKNYALRTASLVCNKFGLAEFFARHFEELLLPRPQRVLDVGCGVGPLGVYFSDQYHCRVMGVELNPIACQCCEENIKRFKLTHRMELINQDFSEFLSCNSDFIPDLIVANPPVNDRVLSDTICQFDKFDYSKIDRNSFIYLTNSWHDSSGQDLTDLIFEYALHVSTEALRVVLVFCLIDCQSPDFIFQKAHRLGFFEEETVQGTISPSSIGVDDFIKHPISTFLISFKMGK